MLALGRCQRRLRIANDRVQVCFGSKPALLTTVGRVRFAPNSDLTVAPR